MAHHEEVADLMAKNGRLVATLEAIILMAKRGSESTDMTRASFRDGLADIEAIAKTAIIND